MGTAMLVVGLMESCMADGTCRLPEAWRTKERMPVVSMALEVEEVETLCVKVVYQVAGSERVWEVRQRPSIAAPWWQPPRAVLELV